MAWVFIIGCIVLAVVVGVIVGLVYAMFSVCDV